MLAWLKKIFKEEEPDIIDKIEIGPITNPVVLPNDKSYRFPDPNIFRAPKVRFMIRHKKKQSQSKKE